METKIADKIKKLLSLANDDGATEAERELAMTRAHEFMLRHNLSMAQLGTDKEETNIVQETLTVGKFKWKSSLIAGIAQANFVKVYLTNIGQWKNYNNTVYLIGKVDNVNFVRELYAYLVPWLEFEANIQARNVHDPRNWKNNFYRAASSRISRRLSEVTNQIVEEENAYALVKNEWSKVNESDPFAANPRTQTSQLNYNPTAWKQGTSAGDKAQINPNKKLPVGNRSLNR